ASWCGPITRQRQCLGGRNHRITSPCTDISSIVRCDISSTYRKELIMWCGPDGEGGHRGRWRFEPFAEFWGGSAGSGRGRHWRGRAGRMFEQGDLKYVILRLLEEKPRHGYEII